MEKSFVRNMLLLDPADVVPHLPGDLFRRGRGDFGKDLDGDLVGLCKVFRVFAHAHPAEGTEAVVEIHRAHDVLDIGRIAETAVLKQDIRPGAGTLQQEGVAVVEEVHALRR